MTKVLLDLPVLTMILTGGESIVTSLLEKRHVNGVSITWMLRPYISIWGTPEE